jgi:hypothetical protein
MDPAPDASKPTSTPEHPGVAAERATPPEPANWAQALMSLIDSRVALIQLEAGQSARRAARRAVGCVIAVLCLFFGWSLLLAAAIAVIAHGTHQPWTTIAFAAAGLHLLIGLIVVRAAKGSAAPAFPITRAEFQKDRAWIENLQQKPKSRS